MKHESEFTRKRFSILEGGLIELEAVLFTLFVLVVWKGAREFLLNRSLWCYLVAWVIVLGYLMYRFIKKD